MVSWGRFRLKFVTDFPDHVRSQKTPFSIPLSRNSILNFKDLKPHSYFRKTVTLLMNMLIVVLRFKGTLMQISKFPYMLAFISKQYPEHFAFLILKILELFTRKVCKNLKNRLIFNMFYCF